MFTYKLHFENGLNSTNTVKNLSEAESIAIATLKTTTLTECEITTPTGSISIVKKDSKSTHWNHPGYSFSMVPAEQVAQYRKIQQSK